MSSLPTYDYLITGAGCAGLSLAVHLVRSGRFADKRILIVDSEDKSRNDRTWCFWEKDRGVFEDVVFRQWDHISFFGEQIARDLPIDPYRYKMIRGADFYAYCRQLLLAQPNISWQQGKVEGVFSDAKGSGAVIDGTRVAATYVFNSILFGQPELKKGEHWLLQHFKGWVIETPEPLIDPQVATLMDFTVPQTEGTSFCYVLPFSAHEALVEFTLFTRDLLAQEAYDRALDSYIRERMGISNYAVREEEFGVIPMTNYRFPRGQGNVVNIGTAGGQTKGSSGYTFRFIQKHAASITEALARTGKPFVNGDPGRFHFYDSVLLDILAHDTLPGRQIFSQLFRRNPPQRVLKFLDNETSLLEELQLISTLPTLPFTRAALRQLVS